MKSRLMTLEDLDQVLAIERKAYSTPWREETFVNELTNNDYSTYLVLEKDGIIVAYGGLWNVLDESHITNIAVDPFYQRQGYGQEMMDVLQAKAIELGAKNMTLEVRVSNVAAQKLYENNGFTVEGRRVRYYSDNNEDAIIMWKYHLEPQIKDRG